MSFERCGFNRVDQTSGSTRVESQQGACRESAPTPPPNPDLPKRDKELSDARRKSPKVTASTVKVSTDKLDNLVDMVGEFLIAESMVANEVHEGRGDRDKLARNLLGMRRISRELQRSAMSLRMAHQGCVSENGAVGARRIYQAWEGH